MDGPKRPVRIVRLAAALCAGIVLLAFRGAGYEAQPEIIDDFEGSLSGWSLFTSPSVDVRYAADQRLAKEGARSMEIRYAFRDNDKPFIAFVVKDLKNTRDWSAYDGVELWSHIPAAARDLRALSVMIYEEDGTAYIAQFARKLSEAGWARSVVPFSTFVFSSGPSSRSRAGQVNLKQIRKIAVGIYQPVPFADSLFSLSIDAVRLVKGGGDAAGAARAAGKNNTPATSPIVDDFSSPLSNWVVNIAPTVRLEHSIDDAVKRQGKRSLTMRYRFVKKEPFWGYVEKDLGAARDWRGYNSLSFWSFIPAASRDLVDLSVMVYEEDGSAYIAQHVRGLKTAGWQEVIVPFSMLNLAGTWTTDENDRLDLDQIKKISIGIYQPSVFSDNDFTVLLNDIRAIQSPAAVQKALSTTAVPVVRMNRLQKFEPPDGRVYHGVFAFSAPQKGWGSKKSDWESQIDPKQISEYESLSGRPVAIVSFVWFFDWAFPAQMCDRIRSLGKIPHVGITMSGIRLSDIIKGNADEMTAQWAAAARHYGEPVFFRFLPEMNGNWNSYSEAYDPSQTHQMYIEAWRRVVTAFRKAGAGNVIWVWAPTAVDIGNIHWTKYYPGDDYVDWVGISVYSFLGNGDPEKLITGVYDDYAARKPVIIAECGAGDADDDPRSYRPGNKYSDNPEKWIDRFFDTLEAKTPRVKAIVWFNIDRELVWKIQESPQKAKRFRERLSRNRYAGAVK